MRTKTERTNVNNLAFIIHFFMLGEIELSYTCIDLDLRNNSLSLIRTIIRTFIPFYVPIDLHPVQAIWKVVWTHITSRFDPYQTSFMSVTHVRLASLSNEMNLHSRVSSSFNPSIREN